MLRFNCKLLRLAWQHLITDNLLALRSQDTIVLSSGENVEPAPIEDACAVSPFIQHLVLVGQDHRMLGALVVPAPEAFAELQDIKGAPTFHPATPKMLTTFPQYQAPAH